MGQIVRKLWLNEFMLLQVPQPLPFPSAEMIRAIRKAEEVGFVRRRSVRCVISCDSSEP